MSTPSTSAQNHGHVDGPYGFGTLLRPIEAAGFWAAIGLPFLYLPLVLTGVETPAEQLAAALLIAVHMVALFVGRRHKAH